MRRVRGRPPFGLSPRVNDFGGPGRRPSDRGRLSGRTGGRHWGKTRLGAAGSPPMKSKVSGERVTDPRGRRCRDRQGTRRRGRRSARLRPRLRGRPSIPPPREEDRSTASRMDWGSRLWARPTDRTRPRPANLPPEHPGRTRRRRGSVRRRARPPTSARVGRAAHASFRARVDRGRAGHKVAGTCWKRSPPSGLVLLPHGRT